MTRLARCPGALVTPLSRSVEPCEPAAVFARLRRDVLIGSAAVVQHEAAVSKDLDLGERVGLKRHAAFEGISAQMSLDCTGDRTRLAKGTALRLLKERCRQA